MAVETMYVGFSNFLIANFGQIFDDKENIFCKIRFITSCNFNIFLAKGTFPLNLWYKFKQYSAKALGTFPV